MFAQQQMNPPPPDPMQRKIFMFMPVAFGGFSLFMPAGLVLYWFVNTLITAGQQWHINRVIEKEEQRRRR
jgi:YidC/Oxa1 family membrane protein insertase